MFYFSSTKSMHIEREAGGAIFIVFAIGKYSFEKLRLPSNLYVKQVSKKECIFFSIDSSKGLGLPETRAFFSSLAGFRNKNNRNLYFFKIFLRGIGYRVEKVGNSNVVKFVLGYSHPIYVKIQDNVGIQILDNQTLIIQNKSSQVLGQIASRIQRLRQPNAYKEKGIFFENLVDPKVGYRILKPGKVKK